MNAGVTTLVFVIVFALIDRGTVDRLVGVLSGAAVIGAFGLVADFFSVRMIAEAIYFETLALIFGMSAISAILARSGFFSLVAVRVVAHAQGNGWWVLVLFSLITYGFSLAVNNLATMVIVAPVTLVICRQMKLNPVPLLIAEIIASNLGGASTMIGDFPNMIISSAGELRFLDFIGGMMVPCLILLAAMLGYFEWRRGEIDGTSKASAGDWYDGMALVEPKTDPRLMKVGLSILGLALAGFILADAIGLRPGWIAMAAGMAALTMISGDRERDWFTACGGQDILFFMGLFVMVGGLVASGALEAVHWLIDTIGGGSKIPIMLVLMWFAAVLTIFLNAGAATAFLVPIAKGFHFGMADSSVVWWALSLGVLAGSSAALTGATAGPVTATFLERFVKAHPEMKEFMSPEAGLDFRGYFRWGLPIMVLFLGLSSLYIIIVA
nr:MamN protein (Magnetosome protein MamN) [uncultured bacterium]